MNAAELNGKVLKVNIAKPSSKNIPHGKSLWSAEEWIQSNIADSELEPSAEGQSNDQ